MNILEEIISHKRLEINARSDKVPEEILRKMPLYDRDTFSLSQSIRTAPGGFGVIAEFKRKSPSAGIIRGASDPVETALSYVRNGASGISILTDERFFGGSLDDLLRVRGAVGIPLLRKDFIIDPYQIHEAKAYGADAVLLIADVLTAGELDFLHGLAFSVGMECLVEVYDAAAAAKLNGSKMNLTGVNNRDLRTFKVDLNHTREMIDRLPDGALVISESGIRSKKDLLKVKESGADGVLIGEWFMRTGGMVLS